ncbi:MAG: hypothetical protein ACKVS5_09185 [Parvularculaceae bacterium]
MQVIFDLMLLMASGAAAVYCFVLSNRLKKLNDIKSGLGASIASMSLTLEQTRAMLAEAKEINQQGSANLSRLIEEADKLSPEINDLMAALADYADAAITEISLSRDVAIRDLQLAAHDTQAKNHPELNPLRHSRSSAALRNDRAA